MSDVTDSIGVQASPGHVWEVVPGTVSSPSSASPTAPPSSRGRRISSSRGGSADNSARRWPGASSSAPSGVATWPR